MKFSDFQNQLQDSTVLGKQRESVMNSALELHKVTGELLSMVCEKAQSPNGYLSQEEHAGFYFQIGCALMNLSVMASKIDMKLDVAAGAALDAVQKYDAKVSAEQN
jgi:hypothetical protein